MVPDHIDPSSSQDTVSRALVEAHKQVSAEAAPVDASASPSDPRKAGSSCDAVAVPSVAPSNEEKKEAALKAHGFVHNEAVHGDGENVASSSRDKQECSSVISPLLSRSEKLCVRHQRMADEDATARLQKVRAPLFLDRVVRRGCRSRAPHPTRLASVGRRSMTAAELPRARADLDRTV